MYLIVFNSNDCPKCKILKTKLDEKNIVYQICSDMDVMIKKGFNSMPVLEVDDKIMNFNDSIKWILSK